MQEIKFEKDDVFALENLYPDPTLLLDLDIKSLREVTESALVFLDANALLFLYRVSNEDLSSFGAVLQQLSESDRLRIPARAFREFAKHRPNKIGEIHSGLLNSFSQAKQPEQIKHRFLADLAEFKALEKEATALAKARLEYNKAHDNLVNVIKSWRWNDPVTNLYKSFVQAHSIVECTMSEDALLSEIERRIKHNIPPGYADKSKNDHGAGDIIIWLTILQEAANKRRNAIFVSSDAKTDWFHQSNGPLHLRYELSYEYAQVSNNHSVHVVEWSELLKVLKQPEKVVRDVKQHEVRERYRNRAIFKNQAASNQAIQALRKLLTDAEILKKEANHKFMRDLESKPEMLRDIIIHDAFDDERRIEGQALLRYKTAVQPTVRETLSELINKKDPGSVDWQLFELMEEPGSLEELKTVLKNLLELEDG
ncbi:PIN domain-containing protein [Fimbriimonas ginsengisoli]|uniref:PIN like domain-containing protein n=1 Tax=Fimbriimonas ginsengisoli Gsoil 348 TaxID=661478 RepID=A0A068NYP7_FIMGI|nr:PIN domain-containing protein [Fimbriimonas ginsengisoli]AIE87194.1 hypothetical protein OP10G_3826 [Fimbriimonas ginsengisoli Gsoil 348]